MERREYLKLLREIKSVAMATVGADGMPRVRMIDVMLVEEGKLYFCTARGKDFYQELLAVPRIAIVGMNADYRTVRLEGMVTHLSEQKRWIDRIFRENPVMNQVYPGESRYILEPFCVSKGNLEVFDLGSVPIFREYEVLGDQARQVKGFEIQKDCIGCGRCRRECPQTCIEPGKPYRIVQEHCLHCGQCKEICPVQAVKGRECR